ncbi:MAG: hypothetical protein H0W06_12730 [Chloroflexia bacterium]|nr:hypothetical protein [Chloroflexia bacterium]
MRRASFTLRSAERRWKRIPTTTPDLFPVLREMRHRGELSPILRQPYLYEVVVPYARWGPLDEVEVLMEANPYAALSHLTALAFHGLTDELPKLIMAVVSLDGRGGQLPIGTEPQDWDGVPLPVGYRPAQILGRPIDWTRVRPQRFFGESVYQPHGYPVRVMTPERTLLDGLLHPDLCGGIANVLRAWALARDVIDLDALVYHVERFNVAVLRQRVGFILDELERGHSLAEEWRASANRGGSSKLVGSAPYSSTYSDRWNLSLNGPTYLLHETGQ